VKVVVVGGGFAGLAAAITLQEHRHQVLLLERRGVLGGRATSYRDAVTGDDVDNGTHLMVGAYHETLDLVARAGASELLLVQDNLEIDYVDDRGPTRLACPPVSAPLHLLFGLLGLRLPWAVRLQAARLALAVQLGGPPSGTLAEYFEKTGQGKAARALLWDGLSTAILNETPERAAAVLFYNVYRQAFLRRRTDSCLVFLRRGFGELQRRLGAYFESRGGVIHRRAIVESVETSEARATGVRYQQRAETKAEIRTGVRTVPGRAEADAVVLAVPWSVAPKLVPPEIAARPPFAGLAGLRGSPIVSVEMWLDRVVVDRVMVGLREGEVEWVFDKGRLHGRSGAPQHLGFIVSAAYRTAPRPNAEIVALAESALRRYFPAMAGAAVTRSLVLREPEATFSCDPASEALRPGPETPVRGLFLAGDWTDTGLPATIEGAVRSGHRAARRVEEME
jgi:squalene-associated FAD-dependent desaturase